MTDTALDLDPMAPVPFRVVGRRRELADTFTLGLEPADGSFQFAPGQFTMLYAFGIGEVPISISGDPAVPGRVTQTIREVGAVTKALGSLDRDDVVGVRGPFGTAWPVDAAAGGDLLIVAGGIGLAPLRPAIYHVLANREHYGDVAILYGARSPDELLFADQLREWGGRFDVTVLVTVDRAQTDWKGPVGVVTRLIRRAPVDMDEVTAFVCGPEIMMRYTARELITEGAQRGRVHLSMERNMKCAVGFCGHCQFGPTFVCKDGPVFDWERLAPLLAIKEL